MDSDPGGNSFSARNDSQSLTQPNPSVTAVNIFCQIVHIDQTSSRVKVRRSALSTSLTSGSLREICSTLLDAALPSLLRFSRPSSLGQKPV